MQFEFVQALRAHRDHAGVMRARADFAEPHLVGLDEQLDAEDTQSAQIVGDFFGDVARALQRQRRHRHRLPAFHIIAVHLHMADGRAEVRFDVAAGADRAHGELGDLIIEIDETFDDDPPLIHTRTAGGIIPCRLHIVRTVQF